MPNMSYCRFQNTSGDLEDCLDHLRDGRDLSKSEYHAALGMFRDFLDFCREVCIIDNYDADQLRGYLRDHLEKEEEE